MYKNTNEINFDIINKEPVNHLQNDQTQYVDFPRISHDLDYSEFFEKFLFQNLPVIFSNQITSKWESVKDWSTTEGFPNLTFFESIIDQESLVPVSDCNKKFFNSQECSEESFASYSQYWQGYTQLYSETEPCKYLKDWHFHRDNKHSYSAYRTPKYFCSDWLNEWWENRTDSEEKSDYRFVYIGPKGSWTPFHTDVFGSYSWSANIVGKKKWIFYPPGEEKKLKDNLGNLVYDVESEEADQLEVKNRSAVKFEIIQNAGEVVFVPSGWHHQVTNLEDTISINHNWFNGCNIVSVYYLLKEELRKVEKEIFDCKDDSEAWTKMCQNLLGASYGMNFLDFLSLLTFILERRLRMLEDEAFTIQFDDYCLGVNHAKFDIFRINLVLQHLVQDFVQLKMMDQVEKCEHLLEECKIHFDK
eukprot:GFUD01001205.1.p1 GENE.GFUD01001205.1~~GFUD01001205.1.p1  ORF type:complete len:416 (+),score=87.05 GFUD01001205.1:31-1278(+)